MNENFKKYSLEPLSVLRLDLATLKIYSFSGPVGQAQPNFAENIFELSLHYQKQNHYTRADIKKKVYTCSLKKFNQGDGIILAFNVAF